MVSTAKPTRAQARIEPENTSHGEADERTEPTADLVQQFKGELSDEELRLPPAAEHPPEFERLPESTYEGAWERLRWRGLPPRVTRSPQPGFSISFASMNRNLYALMARIKSQAAVTLFRD